MSTQDGVAEAVMATAAAEQALTAALGGDSDAADHDAQVRSAEAELRTAFSAEIAARLAGLSEAEQIALVSEMIRAHRDRLDRTESIAPELAGNTGDGGGDVEGVTRAAVEAVEVLLIEIAELYAALAVLDPLALTTRLESLIDLITSTNLGFIESHLPHHTNREQAESNAELAVTTAIFDAAIREYVQIARGGVFFDPETGLPITGVDRQQLAAVLESHLAARLDSAHWESSVIFSWARYDDPRTTLSAERKAEINHFYSPLRFIGIGSGPTMKEFHLAIAIAVDDRQLAVEARFQAYLGNPDDEHWYFDEWFNMGMGTVSRLWDLSGESGVSAVKLRMAEARQHAGVVSAAFRAAAETPDPSKLMPRQLQLLERYGYVVTDAAGVKTYAVPSGHGVVGDATAVDIPGAPILDAISTRIALETLASVYIPELAAGRFEVVATRFAARFGLGGRAIFVGRVAVDITMGAVVDASLQTVGAWAEGKEDGPGFGQLLVDAAIMAPLAMASGALVRLFGERFVIRAAPAARNAVAEITRSAEANRMLRTWLVTALDLGADAAIDVGYQALKTDGDVRFDDYMAALIGAAMAKSAASSFDSFKASLPHSVRVHIDLATYQGFKTRSEHVATNTRLALSEFQNAFSDGRPVTAGRVFDSLLNGTLSWSSLKVAFANRRVAYDTMVRVKQSRDDFFDAFVPAAIDVSRQHLTDQLADGTITNDKYDAEMADLAVTETAFHQEVAMTTEIADAEKTLTGDDLKEAVSAIKNVYNLSQYGANRVIRPGSGDPTSDIDRSWPNERLRNAAKMLIAQAIAGRQAEINLRPTTASAVDVNEYNNIMTWVQRHLRSRNHADGWGSATVKVTLTDGSEVTLTHGQIERANTLASGLFRLNPDQRARYEANFLATAGETGAVQLDLARQQLAQGVADADAARSELIAEGADPNKSDLEILVKERVYTERMVALEALDARIKDPNTPGADKPALIAQFERDANLMLREGIETYSSLASLQIIVVDLQMSGKSITALLDDLGTFRRDGDGAQLAHISQDQIDGFISDQVLMITEHVNEFLDGHEAPATTARALAKYGQRVLLGMKIAGSFDQSNPSHVALKDLVNALIKHKSSPENMQAALIEFGGTADAAVVKIIELMGSLPNMAGVIVLPTGVTTVPYRSSVAWQEWQAVKAEVAEAGGSAAVVALIEAQLHALGQTIQGHGVDAALQRALVDNYLEEDWARATELIHQGATIAAIRHNAPQDLRGEFKGRLAKDYALATSQLSELHLKFRSAASPPSAAATAATVVVQRRGEYLEALREDLKNDLSDARRTAGSDAAGAADSANLQSVLSGGYLEEDWALATDLLRRQAKGNDAVATSQLQALNLKFKSATSHAASDTAIDSQQSSESETATAGAASATGQDVAAAAVSGQMRSELHQRTEKLETKLNAAGGTKFRAGTWGSAIWVWGGTVASVVALTAFFVATSDGGELAAQSTPPTTVSVPVVVTEPVSGAEDVSDETATPSSTEPVTSGTTEPVTTGTTTPVAPDHLQAATPEAVTNLGGGVVEVRFGGDARSLADSGISVFQVTAHVLSGPLTVRVTFSQVDGIATGRASLTDAADARETEDGLGTVTVSTPGEVASEWLDNSTLRMTVTGFEMPADGTIEVQVAVQETSDGEVFVLVPGNG